MMPAGILSDYYDVDVDYNDVIVADNVETVLDTAAIMTQSDAMISEP